jgi:hypothetical protein
MKVDVVSNQSEGFTIEIEIPDDRVKSLLCCGIEGGIGYWCQIVEYKFEPPLTIDDFREGGQFQGEHYYHPSELIPLVPGCAVVFQDVEDGSQYLLDREKIKRGLKVMSTKPEIKRHWADFIKNNSDADTGDVFIQCCIFGDVIYG